MNDETRRKLDEIVDAGYSALAYSVWFGSNNCAIYKNVKIDGEECTRLVCEARGETFDDAVNAARGETFDDAVNAAYEKWKEAK